MEAIILEALDQAARSALEDWMNLQGFELSQEERGRVLACSDIALLDAWIKRAVNAKDAADVFVT